MEISQNLNKKGTFWLVTQMFEAWREIPESSPEKYFFFLLCMIQCKVPRVSQETGHFNDEMEEESHHSGINEEEDFVDGKYFANCQYNIVYI